jgi:AmiR/NasT family two-component response regulator
VRPPVDESSLESSLTSPGGPGKRDQFSVVIASPLRQVGERIAQSLRLPRAHIKHALTTIEVKACLRRAPDLVVLQGLLDLLACVEAVRKQAPETACIVLLENPGLSAVTRMVELKVNALITQPLDDPKVAQRLGEIARRLRTAKLRSDTLSSMPK